MQALVKLIRSNAVSQGKQQKEAMTISKCEGSREGGYMRGQPDGSGNKPAEIEPGEYVILFHSPRSSYCLNLTGNQTARE